MTYETLIKYRNAIAVVVNSWGLPQATAVHPALTLSYLLRQGKIARIRNGKDGQGNIKYIYA